MPYPDRKKGPAGRKAKLEKGSVLLFKIKES